MEEDYQTLMEAEDYQTLMGEVDYQTLMEAEDYQILMEAEDYQIPVGGGTLLGTAGGTPGVNAPCGTGV